MSNVIGVKITGDSAQLQTALKGAGREVEGFGKKAQEATGPLDRLSQGFKSAIVGSSVAVGLIGLKNTLVDVTGALINAQVQVDQLRNGLSFAVGSKNAVAEIAFVRDSVKTMGLEFASAGQQYTKLAAAARGTSLEGQKTRDIFTAVAQASNVLGLSSVETEGALRALGQMISKNTVMSEELKGQFSEHIPGGFQIAARAMGKTTEELNKMLETGQVLAGDLLPKMAAEMTKVFSPEAEKAANSMRANMNRLTTAWTEFKQAVVQGGAGTAIASEAQGMSNYLTVLTEAMDRSRQSGDGFATMLSTGLGTALARVPFDATAGAANFFNGTINLLTGGVLGLKTNIDLLPQAFETNAQKSAALTSRLTEAESELGKLQTRLSVVPDNIYLKSETYQAFLLVQQLRAAKQAQDQLKGTPESVTAAGARAGGEARTAWVAQNAANQASLQKIKDKQNGIPDGYAKELAEIERLYKAGTISGSEYNAMLTKQQSLLVKSQGSGTVDQAAKKAAAEHEKAYKTAIDAAQKLGDIRNKDYESIQDYTAAETLRLLQTAHGSEEAVRLAQQEFDNHGKLKSEIAATTLTRLQDQLVTKTAGTEAYDSLVRQIEAQKQLIGIMRKGEVRDAGEKAADDLRDANKKAAEEAGKYWEDALMRAFESGKGFFQSLWDTIKNTIKTQVLRVSVQGVMGTLGIGASGAAMADGSGGGIASTLSVAQTLKGVYDVAMGGFASSVGSLTTAVLGQTAGNAALGAAVTGSASASAAAAAAAAEAGGASAAAAASSASTGAAIGSAASVLGPALAGISIGSLLAGNKVVLGMDGTTTSAIGTAIGFAVGGPLGAVVGGALGGLTNALFGRGPTEVQSQGTRGTFSAGGTFAGQNYANLHQDGGWFRSDRNWTQTSAIDPKTVNAWQTAFVGVKTSVAQMASSLGLSTDQIASYSKSIDLAAGTTAEQLTAVFTGMADEMAQTVLGTTETVVTQTGRWIKRFTSTTVFNPSAYIREGETASVALARLSTSLALANQWLGQFNDTLLATSLAAGDQASKLIDGFGGTEAFSAAQNTYYQAMYTDAQRLADTTVNVAKGLALVGVAMPATLEAYNKLRDAQDLMTESGRSAYTVMTLLGPEFAQVADAAKTAADASVKLMTDVFDTLDKRLTSLIDSIASERDSVAGARDSILNGAPKTYAELQAGITAAKVALPSDAGVLSAQAALAAKTTAASTAANTAEIWKGELAKVTAFNVAKVDAAQAAFNTDITKYKTLSTGFKSLMDAYGVFAWGSDGKQAYQYYDDKNRINNFSNWNATTRNDPKRDPNYFNYTATLNGANTVLAASEKALTTARTSATTEIAAYTKVVTDTANAATLASTAKTAAEAVAKQALLNYAAAMAQYSGDAEKAVKVLSKLREETVAYYEAQKEISGIMATSATTLRGAAIALSSAQLGPVQSAAQQQAEFAKNYNMALAIDGTQAGALKASYADKLTAALPGLSEAIKATTSTQEWALASARLAAKSIAIADLLTSDAAAMNFEADSLSLLGSIDLALGELDTNTSILKNAIDSGTNATAANLRVIATRLGGVPAFAGGGYHSGGIRLVGENGPELEVTGPSRIFNASQLSAGGNSAELAAEIRALRQEVAELRKSNTRENTAIMTQTALTADATRRMDKNGVLVYTDPAEPLKTEPVL
jgi:tape measure domain-containing protein